MRDDSPRGISHTKWTRVLVVPVKKGVVISLSVFSLEKSTAGVFEVPFRVLNLKETI